MRFWLWAIGVLLLDQLTKALIVANLARGQTLPIVNGYWHITYIRNPGGAFGLMPRNQVFFLIASFAVIALIVVYAALRRPEGRLAEIAFGLILGGTAGNLIDRLRYGEVIDWLDFRVWPVFNVADMALVTGLVLLAWLIMRADTKPRDEKSA